MKYWEDFQTKWGFSEGAATPDDAWAHRFVYVREINRKAAELASKVRLVAYDRGGMHNGLLIVRVPMERPEGVYPEVEMCNGTAGNKIPSLYFDTKDDAQMDAAINYFTSGEEEIDSYVQISVTILEEDDTGELVDSKTL
jgi:hypothetical protein